MLTVTGSRSRFITLGAVAIFTTNSYAQVQPPQTVNQQDEVVTIHLSETQGPDDVLEILRTGDKFEAQDYVTRAYELFNVDAYELKPYITEAAAREKGVVRAAVTKPPEGQRARHFLLVSTTPQQLPWIGESIRALDVPGFVNSQGRSRRAIRLKYRLASDLGTVLLNTRLTSQGRAFADDLTNTLYYDDSDYVSRALDDYVAFYDVPTPQIEFDIQIYELREDNIAKIGLDWDAWKRVIGGQFDVTGNWFEGGDRFARLDALLALDASVLASFLNYTAQSGNARVIQRSRLNASNLDPALISDVKRVPYIDYIRTEKAPAILTENHPKVDSYKEYEADEEKAQAPRIVTIVPPVTNKLAELSSQDEGLLVRIQPVIGTHAVTADIDVMLNTLSGYDQLDRPVITRQVLNNLVTLQHEEKLLLGSIERETTVKARRGIPGLKDIPVVKHLISVETKRSDNSRLFIVATPRFSSIGYDAKNLVEVKENKPILGPSTRSFRVDENVLRESLFDDSFGGSMAP